jgi:hypothetical protein
MISGFNRDFKVHSRSCYTCPLMEERVYESFYCPKLGTSVHRSVWARECNNWDGVNKVKERSKPKPIELSGLHFSSINDTCDIIIEDYSGPDETNQYFFSVDDQKKLYEWLKDQLKNEL